MNIFFYSAFIIVCYFAIKNYIKIAIKYNIVDLPSERRSHSGIVARGGGVVIVLLTTLFYIFYSFYYNIKSFQAIGLILTCFALAIFFFIEDIKQLPIKIRLFTQSIAVLLGIFFLKNDISTNIFPLIPFWFKAIIIFIGWLWYINLYNFMDGINGITAMQTGSICVYILILLTFIGTNKYVLTQQSIIDSEVVIDMSDDVKIESYEKQIIYHKDGLINYSPFIYSLLIAIIIFFLFNKTPSKIFIGDSGSIGLGFILGALLIKIGCEYSILSAFCVTMYYIFDSTLTVLLRIKDGEKIWTPHLRHFFIKIKRAGFSDIKICGIILFLNIVLSFFGYLIIFFGYSRIYVVLFFLLSILITFGYILYFEYIFKNRKIDN